MKCIIIAEAGVNHNGSVAVARQLVDAAAQAGADVVKFQTFRADKLASPVAPKAEYMRRNEQERPAGESMYELLRRLELPEQAYAEIWRHCRDARIQFLSTPFDLDSIALLQQLGVAFWKIPSGEITNLPYLRAIARTGKPVVLSTGMSVLREVEEAVRVLELGGVRRGDITLLHCNTAYPTPLEDANVRAMVTLREAFGLRVGYSDHTPGIEAALAAVALGAEVIEKHFTLDRNMEGPDHKASLEPDELTALVRSVRKVELCLGTGRKEASASEAGNAAVARKSLHVRRDLPSGHVLAEVDLEPLRPGDGISPMAIGEVVGRVARNALPAGRKLEWGDLR